MTTSINAKEVLPTLKKSILADGMDMVLDLDKSAGAKIYDSKNDRTLIDFFSFFASNPIGFNHPKLHEESFEEKLLKYSRVKVSNSDIYTEGYAEFVKSFHEFCAPTFDRVFFIEGGALGVENALKVAMDWKAQKNKKAGVDKEGGQILHFKQAFHGRTGYTLSLTNTLPDKIKYFPKFDWPRVTNPKLHFPLTEDSLKTTIALEEQSIQEIEKAFKDRPNEICAILLEPIQGEGGDNFFRKEFHQKLKELSLKHEALLIYDEVQTGMGLTGKMWAHEYYGVKPDVIAFGKKSQVCGCAVRLERLEEVDHVFKVPSRINSTFGGNLSDMVRTTQFIEIMKEENLLDHAASLGKKMLEEIQALRSEFDFVTNARGLGLWLAFDLPDTQKRNEALKACWDAEVIVIPCGDKTIRLRPVLNLTQEEADEGFKRIRKALSTL